MSPLDVFLFVVFILPIIFISICFIMIPFIMLYEAVGYVFFPEWMRKREAQRVKDKKEKIEKKNNYYKNIIKNGVTKEDWDDICEKLQYWFKRTGSGWENTKFSKCRSGSFEIQISADRHIAIESIDESTPDYQIWYSFLDHEWGKMPTVRKGLMYGDVVSPLRYY